MRTKAINMFAALTCPGYSIKVMLSVCVCVCYSRWDPHAPHCPSGWERIQLDPLSEATPSHGGWTTAPRRRATSASVTVGKWTFQCRGVNYNIQFWKKLPFLSLMWVYICASVANKLTSCLLSSLRQTIKSNPEPCFASPHPLVSSSGS